MQECGAPSMLRQVQRGATQECGALTRQALRAAEMAARAARPAPDGQSCETANRPAQPQPVRKPTWVLRPKPVQTAAKPAALAQERLHPQEAPLSALPCRHARQNAPKCRSTRQPPARKPTWARQRPKAGRTALAQASAQAQAQQAQDAAHGQSAPTILPQGESADAGAPPGCPAIFPWRQTHRFS